MTREEAILLLHDMKDTYDEIHENTNYEIGYEQMTALDMAIEALQREDRFLKSLETNEPIYDMVDVVRCKDCKHQRIDPANDRLGIRVCDMYEHTTTSDFFCACGERRDDAT